MLPGYVQLRSDLVVSRQDTTAGAVFVVKDPATGRFFRLREAEHFIARQLDGSTPLERCHPAAGRSKVRFLENFDNFPLSGKFLTISLLLLYY